MQNRLSSRDNQFGYKRKTSTDKCIFSFKEIVNHYHSLNTPVYACFIDVKSAFDRLSHWKLYQKLIAKGIPKKIINILKFWNLNQKLCVNWGSSMSHHFYMGNGIRQGSLISPFLYNLYVDLLSERLSGSRIGCFIGDNAVNNLSWADDLVVMAPSAHALIDLLNICDIFAEEHLIIYNTKKTKCMLFHCNASPILEYPVIKLSKRILDFVDQFTYLGHIISNDMSDNCDIYNQNKKLCARGNMIVRKFKHCSPDIKCLLFKTYCYSIYGSSLWSSYTLAAISRIRVNYNNILRRLFNVPPWHSASQLFVRLGLRGFKEQRRTSSYSLMQRVMHSGNEVVQTIVNSDARAHSTLWTHWDTMLRG